MRTRYHRDIGLPAGAPLRPPTTALNYLRHALDAALEDRVDLRLLPRTLDQTSECVELTMNQDGTVWRWLLRMPVLPARDLCLVVEEDGTVVTCWTNQRTDTHRTLDRTLYATPARRLHERN